MILLFLRVILDAPPSFFLFSISSSLMRVDPFPFLWPSTRTRKLASPLSFLLKFRSSFPFSRPYHLTRKAGVLSFFFFSLSSLSAGFHGQTSVFLFQHFLLRGEPIFRRTMAKSGRSPFLLLFSLRDSVKDIETFFFFSSGPFSRNKKVDALRFFPLPLSVPLP